MSSFRPNRAHFNAVTNPTVTHVASSISVSNSEAETFLSQFIEKKDEISQEVGFNNNQTGETNFINPAIMSQLKRIQRNLRGLPPTLERPEGFNKQKNTSSADEVKVEGSDSRHTKFDDGEDVEIEVEVVEGTGIVPEVQEVEGLQGEEAVEEEDEEEKEIEVKKESKIDKESKKEKKSKKDKKEKKEKRRKSKADEDKTKTKKAKLLKD